MKERNNSLSFFSQGKNFLYIELFLILICCFFFQQSRLYNDNQNVYFLHALSQLGIKNLSSDWLSQSVDPFPVFTLFAKLSISFFSEKILYIYFLLVSYIYVFSLYKISEIAIKYKPTILRLLFFLIFIVILVGAKRYLSYGVARQYLLGTYFQPSSFGILILLSIYLFLKKFNYWASIILAVASTIHPTYLLVSLFIFTGYLFVLLKEDRKKAFFLAVFQLILVLPIAIYSLIAFAATNPEISAEAKDILVNFRIPHHAKFDAWFGLPDLYRISIIIISLVIIRKTRLFPVIAISFILSVFLSFIQVVSGSNGLALLFPWRISVVLVPVSASIIIYSTVMVVSEKLGNNCSSKIIIPVQIGLFLLVCGLAIPRVVDFTNLFIDREGDQEKIISLISENSKPGDLYVIPKENSAFRIKTGSPILVDRKSHPYKDIEVVEWYKRLKLSDSYYSSGAEACAILDNMIKEYGVTHLYTDRESKVTVCDNMSVLYEVGDSKVYTLGNSN